MNILAFAATNNHNSINQQLVKYTVSQFSESQNIKTIDLREYESVLFSPQRLAKSGLPASAQKFCKLIDWADVIIISFAEYNGSYTPAFKNLFDWASTTKELLWQNKKLFLMATSPGKRGAKTVLTQATSYFPFMGAQIVGSFSLPSFNQNFAQGCISNPQLDTALKQIIKKIEAPIEITETPKNTEPKWIKPLGKVWVVTGYALLLFITLNGWLGAPWFAVTTANIYWEIAMIAATFALVIRPIYDLFPNSNVLKGLLKWRKGIGLISSAIVVGFWLSRNISWSDPTVLMHYFSTAKWSLSLENVLERTTEITAWMLFLISNQWMVKHANTLWRQLQKLAYVYFLSATTLLTVIHEKTYGLVCLVLFFVIYQAWIYKRLMEPEYDSHSNARKSQAS